MLGEQNIFICRECGRKKRGNFFISETLCKKCAAKRRLKKENPVIEISNGVFITKNVLHKIRRYASVKVPLTFIDWLARLGTVVIIIAFWYFGPPINLHSISIGYFKILFGLFWYTMFPFLCAYLFFYWLNKPRELKIGKVALELAKQRQDKIETTNLFYASPEWKILRKEIIKNNSNICAECGCTIKHKFNITVDHIFPRSKYPDLSLQSTNLRVLCRKCNSKKGAKI